MNLLLRVIAIIGILLLVLLIILVSMALVLGFAIGIGFLLTLFLPFDLFQASLLALVAGIIAIVFWRNLLRTLLPFGGLEGAEFDEDEIAYDDDYDRIPGSRFYDKEADKTWETWLRYHFANSIYIEFQDSPQPIAPMGKKQLQELAIRLADLAISFLKAKHARAKKLHVTMAALRQQMNKQGQRPYDDEILRLATIAINEELDYHYDDVLMVISSRLWTKPYDGVVDWEWF